MCNTRFIFVEGIMGSGKSTTAVFLEEHLQKNGIAALSMSEGGPLRVALDLPHPNGAPGKASLEYASKRWLVRELKAPVVLISTAVTPPGPMTPAW